MLTFGNTAVPWTVGWTGGESFRAPGWWKLPDSEIASEGSKYANG